MAGHSVYVCVCSCSSSFVIEFKDDSSKVPASDSIPGSSNIPSDSVPETSSSTDNPALLISDLANSTTLSGYPDGSSTDDSAPTTSGGQECSVVTSGWQEGSNITSGVQDGCFSRALLRDRDELSSAGSGTQSTEDKDEQRGNLPIPILLPVPFCCTVLIPCPLADSIADLGAEPPTYLFIQMQLCKKESLKDWLRSNVTNRCHGKVMHFFDQVSLITYTLGGERGVLKKGRGQAVGAILWCFSGHPL